MKIIILTISFISNIIANEVCEKVTSYRGGFYTLKGESIEKIYKDSKCQQPMGMIEKYGTKYNIECISHGMKTVYSLDMAIKWMIARCEKADAKAGIPWK